MRITIEPTDQVTDLDGVRVRVWRGVTESGVPCTVFVHRLAVRYDQDTEQFDRELQEQIPSGRFVPLRLVLP